MLSTDDAKAASDILFGHWRDRTVLSALPEGLRPQTRQEGYAIQAGLEAKSARPIAGWKIAATSKAGQAHIGVSGPMAGRILAERVVEAGGTASLGGNRMRVAEVEFAFRMARDLAPRAEPYAMEEVLDAVGGLLPAIELPDSRFEDFITAGEAQLIADDACAHQFAFGAETGADWRALDLAAHAAVGRVAGRYEREGSGASVLDDPRIALTWLANELSGLGITLRVGQIVSTGTCTKPLEVEPGDAVTADLGPLGQLTLRLS
jgi:2-keto-4-pentenoate hydratase